MKFKILAIILLGFTLGVNAQTDTLLSKKGTPILPQEGDIAVGFNAMPYLEFLGNMFNGTEDNTLNLTDQDIYMRYYLTANTAIRFNLGLYNNTSSTRKYVQDDAAVASNPLDPYAVVEDERTLSIQSYSFMAGYQWFRGYGRLRGFYGAQLGYAYTSVKAEYTYGNQMTSLNPEPSTYYWDTPERGYRLLESNYGNTHTLLGGGFVGVEYYFAPKMCIGGECRLTYACNFNGQAYEKSEEWSGDAAEVIDTEVEPATVDTAFETSGFGASGNMLSNGLAAAGQIYLVFHF